MTYEQLASLIIDKLEPLYGTRESRAMQRYIFRALTRLGTASLLMRKTEEAGSELENKVLAIIPLLLDNMPVQYAVGLSYFCDLEFIVTPDVLIPRPETEDLVMKILKDLSSESVYNLLDIGTGSGAIAISLAKNLPLSLVTAIDISSTAIKIASINSKNNKTNVCFIEDNILQLTTKFETAFDVIVSNPPYVKDSEMALMSPNVLKHEPYLALFVRDDDPLIFYRAIVEFSSKHLKPGGSLWFEINEAEGINIEEMLKAANFKAVELMQDINERPRFVRATK